MQIMLTKRGQTQDIESYIKTVFAHISHKIWIKDIQVINAMPTFMANQTRVLITCLPQGDTLENNELAQEVEDAVSLRGDLTLERINITPTVQPEAIQQIENNKYTVDPYFAEYLSRKDQYRESLLKQNVKKVCIEYQKVGPNAFRSTGKIATNTQGNSSIEFDPTNIYHCFADAITTNPNLKERLLNDTGIRDIELSKSDGELNVNIISQTTYNVKLPKPKQISENNLAKVTNLYDKIKLVDNQDKDKLENSSPRMTKH